MSALALALALAASSPLGSWAPSPPSGAPSWWGSAGRVYSSARIHAGVRPALYVTSEGRERAAGFTLQVSWSGAL